MTSTAMFSSTTCRVAFVLFILLSAKPSHSTCPVGDVQVASEARLDVFHRLTADTADVLTTDGLQDFIQGVVRHLECHDSDDEHEDLNENHKGHGHCQQALCLNATSLMHHVGVQDLSAGISEDQFASASLVLLYYVTKLQEVCHTDITLSNLTLEEVTEHLLNLTRKVDAHDADVISSSGISNLLESVEPYLSHEQHEHHDDHDHEHHDDDEDHNDHDDHDHDDHTVLEDHDNEDHDNEDHNPEDHAHEEHNHDHADNHGDHDHGDYEGHDHDEHPHEHANDTSHDHHANETSVDHEGHDHDRTGKHDHGDHDGHGHEENLIEHSNDTSHDHYTNETHSDHDHSASSNNTGHDPHHHEHSHDHNNSQRRRRQVDGHDHHDDHGHDAHADHERDDHNVHDNHDQEGNDHDGHDHGGLSTEGLVVKSKCLSSDAVLYYMGMDVANEMSNTEMGQMAGLILYLLHEGSDIGAYCRLLPRKEKFSESIFAKYATGNGVLNVEDLGEVMSQLKINPEQANHDHQDHSGHNHARRRRNVALANGLGSRVKDRLISRVKRQAVTDSTLSQCYTANQFAALYDSQSGISQSAFEKLCPALVSQQLFADCSPPEKDSSSGDVPDAEKYGYGSVAILLICLCSVLGIAFVTCASSSAYGVLMSSMMGLAVGTLFADSVLHLIPMAMGIHEHGSEGHVGHDHGDEIKVEEHVSYGMLILAGLYVFYILEVVMNRLGGHSHSHGEDEVNSELKGFSNGVMISKSEEDGAVASETTKKGLSPVALMIVLGDAIHNFADGLAVGAGFSSSVSTGVATSIAVFCHELPHELGDFAVLLQSGLGYKRTVLLNLLSSLTAFIGLYVGLVISEDPDNKKWIFAVAAGMFMYIALVDLLPQLINTRNFLHLVLNNIGITVGFGIMLLIAVFEEHIEI